MDQEQMAYGKDHGYVPLTSVAANTGSEVAPGLFYYTLQAVNCCMVSNPEKTEDWVLVDAGMPKSAEEIVSAAEKRFGTNHRPQAIVLTHGHIDHVGSVIELVEHWDLPVFAHELELPYLTGKKDYPEPDPTVEGGMVAKISPLLPNKGIDLGNRVNPLPPDGSIPGMDGWRWIHTPGHTPGHISLFRDADRAMIAGDAFITVRQDSLFKVITQVQEVNGPPRYFTIDWQTAWESVKKLEALKPKIAVTGHGIPMSGTALAEGLKRLVEEFDQIAIPDYGKFVDKNVGH